MPSWKRTRNTWKFQLLLSTIAAIAILSGLMISYKIGRLSSRIDANLMYSEQIDFILECIIEDLEKDNDPLANRISEIKSIYNPAVPYEDPPFWKAMEKAFPGKLESQKFYHQPKIPKNDGNT
jgi:hypothetical protein